VSWGSAVYMFSHLMNKHLARFTGVFSEPCGGNEPCLVPCIIVKKDLPPCM
jgi:hypothetical protein